MMIPRHHLRHLFGPQAANDEPFKCNTSYKKWQKFAPGYTPARFFREITKDLPKGTQVRMDFEKDGEVSLYIEYDKNPEENFYFARTFEANNRVRHDRANVSVQLHQQNIASKVNRNLMAFYQARGTEEIALYATEVGAYAWARMGFVPEADEWKRLKKDIRKRLNYLATRKPRGEKPLPKQYVALLRAALKSPDPKVLWFIADQTYAFRGEAMGKMLLLPDDFLPIRHRDFRNNYYDATFNMKDPDCLRRFNAYILKAGLQQPKPKTLKHS